MAKPSKAKKFGLFETSSTVIQKYVNEIESCDEQDFPELACRLLVKSMEFAFFTKLNVDEANGRLEAIMTKMGIWQGESASGDGFKPKRLRDAS